MLTQEKLDNKTIEQINNSPEIQKRVESEARYAITDRSRVEHYIRQTDRITQTYISKPSDEYSLRVRKIEKPSGEIAYKATLKDRGEAKDNAIHRIEVETEINPEAYEYFANNPAYPTLHKNRATIQDGVTIDFIDGLEHPILEIEGDNLYKTLGYLQKIPLANITNGNPSLNEHLAYELNNNAHPEIMSIPSTEELADSILESSLYAHKNNNLSHTVIGIAGASGSGKSTVAKMVADKIEAMLGKDYRPSIISTDDYHRGKQWLEETHQKPWTNWDHPLTYDTELLAYDLKLLREGQPLIKRHFDFQKEEVVYDEMLKDSPFVIVEGIHAGSKDLAEQRNVLFEMPTGHATSIGRDLMRIIIENRANGSFDTPEARLRYQMEVGLPTYLAQATLQER